ncbi:uncharacterized protein LOC116266462 isoform X2 [Nymphaea colorata]|uniref:uncharacterized protein LOC116266462 isoform X2 n=1 Tax=Nymphaea colorata TaxID=210225 RepID=UPI00129EED3C|nr:uncharacterized protein LOC116266462 isoform X2 [Nymphaea colorata]XP_031503560.1 uncharacterized protein LOC116266462 isoform X2 [Nymphaea colorata]
MIWSLPWTISLLLSAMETYFVRRRTRALWHFAYNGGRAAAEQQDFRQAGTGRRTSKATAGGVELRAALVHPGDVGRWRTPGDGGRRWDDELRRRRDLELQQGVSSAEDCEYQISELEEILDSKVFNLEDRNDLEVHVPMAIEIKRYYSSWFVNVDLKGEMDSLWTKFVEPELPYP